LSSAGIWIRSIRATKPTTGKDAAHERRSAAWARRRPVIPAYIGFRDARKTPVVTSDAARSTASGSTVVSRRRNAVADDSSSPARAAATRPAPVLETRLLTDALAIAACARAAPTARAAGGTRLTPLLFSLAFRGIGPARNGHHALTIQGVLTHSVCDQLHRDAEQQRYASLTRACRRGPRSSLPPRRVMPAPPLSRCGHPASQPVGVRRGRR